MKSALAPAITLLSDFGLRDSYVAQMKGVILQRWPEARLVDITHEIPPQDIGAAAFVLSETFAAFPPGCVHLAVVDPGVGGSRRAIVAQAGGHLFVGPDNGLLWPALERAGAAAIYRIVDPRCLRQPVSASFHGRDVFAPTAAMLGAGLIAAAQVGPAVLDPVRRETPRPAREIDEIRGLVVAVDHYGNLITNITAEMVDTRAIVRLDGWPVDIALSCTYADMPPRTPCALLGSSGRLEIAVRDDSAAAVMKLGTGCGLRLRVPSCA